MSIVRKITLFVRGDTEADFEGALAEATALLNDGDLAGANTNETSGFYFESTDDVPEGDQPR